MPSHSVATVAWTSSATWVTSPTSRAKAASNGSPVRNAAASRLPLARRRIGTEMIAAATPMRTSVSANVRSRCATTRSHDAMRPIPPARAGPSTAAIVGTSASISRRRARTIGEESGAPVRRSLRSAPAQNAGGTWVRTMARTDPSVTPASATSRARLRSSTNCLDRALRLAGESRVIVATASSTATCTSSSVMADDRRARCRLSVDFAAIWP